MARATVKTGNLAGIYVGSDKLVGAVEYSSSGSVRQIIEANEMGYDIDNGEYGSLDPGTIDVPNVLSDPTSAAQAALDAAITAGTKYAPDGIKFMRDATSYWTVGTGGYILVTKAGGRSLGRNKLEMCGYSFKLVGAELVLKPSLESIAITITGGGALTLAVGATAQLIATGTYSDSSTAVITSSVTWASADETKIVVTRGGLVAGISADAGTDITATMFGITGTGSVATTTTP